MDKQAIHTKQQQILQDILVIIRMMNSGKEGVPMIGVGMIDNFTYAIMIQLARLDVLVKAEQMDDTVVKRLKEHLLSLKCKEHKEGELCNACIMLSSMAGVLEG